MQLNDDFFKAEVHEDGPLQQEVTEFLKIIAENTTRKGFKVTKSGLENAADWYQKSIVDKSLLDLYNMGLICPLLSQEGEIAWQASDKSMKDSVDLN